MISISDTSPISNLLRIDQLALLQQLCGWVIIPPIVYKKILALEASRIALSWLSDKEELLFHQNSDISEIRCP